MIERTKQLSLLSLLFLIISCASGVPYLEMNPSLEPENSGTGRIFFYRVTGFGGAAIQPEIFLNEEKVGRSIPQGFFYLDKPPGEYVVVTTTEVKRKCSFVLEEGQTRYIRFGISIGFFAGHVYGELVGPEEAKEQIKKCKYTDPADMLKAAQ
jgi:hypothetical protein